MHQQAEQGDDGHGPGDAEAEHEVDHFCDTGPGALPVHDAGEAYYGQSAARRPCNNFVCILLPADFYKELQYEL